MMDTRKDLDLAQADFCWELAESARLKGSLTEAKIRYARAARFEELAFAEGAR